MKFTYDDFPTPPFCYWYPDKKTRLYVNDVIKHRHKGYDSITMIGISAEKLDKPVTG